MALLAVGPELAAMLILMTGETSWMKPFERLAEVVYLDLLPVGRRNIPGVMALLATEAGMAADQRIACLAMIELLFRCLPFENAEAFAIVLGVASRAIGIALGRVHYAPVHAFAVAYDGPNLAVAVQAFQLGRARSEHVATRAIQRTIQRVMCPGQRSGGYLSVNPPSKDYYDGAKNSR